MLGKWVERKVAEVIQPLVGEVVKLKNEVGLKASKDEVEELAREITELNVALDRVEKETVEKAYKELIKRLDTEIKLYRDAIKRDKAEVEALVRKASKRVDELSPLKDTIGDYSRFKTVVEGRLTKIENDIVGVQEFEEFRAGVDTDFKRLDETLEALAKRLEELDKRIDGLEERLKKLEEKKTRRSRKSKKS